REQLLSKNGTATMKLSRELLNYAIGDRIPTITEFSERIHLARGTIQNALKNLINSKAVGIESKGHLGSYLVRKNNAILLEFAGITYLVGAMPLPYSKRYEGLASGIIISSENQDTTPIDLAYMRGSRSRMSMIDHGRYDFAIVSRYAAEEYIKEKNTLEIALSFGTGSYTGKHVLMLHERKDDGVKDGMKVGIDESSYDQIELTEIVCRGRKVEYVPIEYSRTIECVQNGTIDATVMNVDEVLDKKVPIHYVEIEGYDPANTEAVVVSAKANPEIASLLKELIDVDTVLNIQKLVLEDKIIPRY
ncbi:MAG: hypothetical protein II529_03015, partial [Erysipelotrichaceae bacterium]|nr:hypothetical protein [Erysipelotrichaceae bacterium]